MIAQVALDELEQLVLALGEHLSSPSLNDALSASVLHKFLLAVNASTRPGNLSDRKFHSKPLDGLNAVGVASRVRDAAGAQTPIGPGASGSTATARARRHRRRERRAPDQAVGAREGREHRAVLTLRRQSPRGGRPAPQRSARAQVLLAAVVRPERARRARPGPPAAPGRARAATQIAARTNSTAQTPAETGLPGRPSSRHAADARRTSAACPGASRSARSRARGRARRARCAPGRARRPRRRRA